MMGDNPVIFAPSHRSYGDFILMSYLCFHYKIEIPAIAAGMGKQMHVGVGIGMITNPSAIYFNQLIIWREKVVIAQGCHCPPSNQPHFMVGTVNAFRTSCCLSTP